MQAPIITSYRIEEIELPPPKSEQQILYEVMGIVEPNPPVGEPRKVLEITLEGDGLEMSGTPFDISIGDQVLDCLKVFGGGARVSGLIERVPNEGDQIVIHTGMEEDSTLIAGHFEISKLTDTPLA